MDLLTNETRLYRLSLPDSSETPASGPDPLAVEAFAAFEAVNGLSYRDVFILSTDATLDLDSWLNQSARLQIRLADGTYTTFSGLVIAAELLGSEGGLARYGLRLAAWLWRLTLNHTSRVWQEQPVPAIIDDVLSGYPDGAWRWSPEVAGFMADARPRSYCVQYRESDYHFVCRLLAEEGLNWRFEEAEEAPLRHRLIIFADSADPDAIPEDRTSLSALGGPGIRFQGGRAQESQDSIQALAAQRRLNAALTTVLSYDYKAKQAVTASAPSLHAVGGAQAPVLESYDAPGAYAYADLDEARRYAGLHQAAREARNQRWQARSTLRSLRPGTRFGLTQSPLASGQDDGQPFLVLAVAAVGINNLPRLAQTADTALLAALPALLQECLAALAALAADDGSEVLIEPAHSDWPALCARAVELGYANQFSAIRAEVPWRPLQAGLPLHNAKPTALGSQTAIVVGAHGETYAAGGDESYADRLGRVRIKFPWQHNTAACWVRVAQRSAGGGMGSQFLPRIGQEVHVQFLEGDIDRPLITGALFNGRGEGGVVPTPGGQVQGATDATVFNPAHDHQTSGQGNLAGGHSPVWHGASSSSDGHRNAAAQWGIRSKEFGGSGYNQLLFDDSDHQGRVQLKTTQAATELNLGHLRHTADNFRGSFRGLGAELRTDAYGALRAGAGWLVSSFPIEHSASRRDPAGDNAPGMAHLKHLTHLAATFNQAATLHQTVPLAAHRGTTGAGHSLLSADSAPQAPLAAQLTAVSGMADSQSLAAAQADAQSKTTQASHTKVPHSTDPLIALTAQGGLTLTAAHGLQLTNGEVITLASGHDSQFITGGPWRLNTGQAIGVLAGATASGPNQLGLQVIAAQDPIDLQAHNGTLAVQAQHALTLTSSHAHSDWAAAQGISISTAAGANITIDNGNITVQCPGKLTIQSGKKRFIGPGRVHYPLPVLPTAEWINKESLRFCFQGSDALVQDMGLVNKPYKILDDQLNILSQGTIPKDGRLPRVFSENSKQVRIEVGEDKWEKFQSTTTSEELPNFIENPVDNDPYISLLSHENDNSFLTKEQISTLIGKVEGEE